MELSQVRYFLTLCKTLNFTRAAEACNVTQPAFTRAIQKLEAEFGGPLLFRERNLTQLTELGRNIRPHLEAMLEGAEAATAIAKSAKTSGRASLKIGLGPGVGATAVAGAVRAVAQRLPDIAIHFEEAGASALADAMLTDRLDCALLPEFCDIPERLNRWPLYTEIAVAVLPPEHRLAEKNAVTAGDVAGEKILTSEYCGGFANRLAEDTGMTLRLQNCQVASAQLLDLIGAGFGMALLSNRLRIAPPVTTRPFHEPELRRKIFLTAVAGRPLNPAAANFVKLCRSQAF